VYTKSDGGVPCNSFRL